MNEALGIRLENNFLKKIELISKEELVDRSTALRKLIELGYKSWIKKKPLMVIGVAK